MARTLRPIQKTFRKTRTENPKESMARAGRYCYPVISYFRYEPVVCYRRITGVAMAKKAAIYVRVSTDKQTVENQLSELRQIAERRGWEVFEEYRDAGISGAKGRDGRPGLDQTAQ
jgi:hypothetical protein